jgi:hypothetical protein
LASPGDQCQIGFSFRDLAICYGLQPAAFSVSFSTVIASPNKVIRGVVTEAGLRHDRALHCAHFSGTHDRRLDCLTPLLQSTHLAYLRYFCRSYWCECCHADVAQILSLGSHRIAALHGCGQAQPNYSVTGASVSHMGEGLFYAKLNIFRRTQDVFENFYNLAKISIPSRNPFLTFSELIARSSPMRSRISSDTAS